MREQRFDDAERGRSSEQMLSSASAQQKRCDSGCRWLRRSLCGVVGRKEIPVLATAILIEALAEVSRGFLIPSFKDNVSRLGLPLSSIGIAVALFSVGRLASSFAFGWGMTRFPIQRLLLAALGLGFVGNALYSFSTPSVPWLLYPGRAIAGGATGTLSVARGLITVVTSDADRMKLMSCLDAARFIGYALSPGLGGAVTQIGSLNPVELFNREAIPGWFLVFFDILAVLPLVVYRRALTFIPRKKQHESLRQERDENLAPSQEPMEGDEQQPGVYRPLYSDSSEEEGKRRSRWRRLFACSQCGYREVWLLVFCATNLVSRGTVALMEASLSILYGSVFVDTDDDLSSDTGEFLVVLGSIGFVLQLGLAYFSNRVNATILLVSGLVLTAAGTLLLIPPSTGAIPPGRMVVGAALVWSFGSVMTSISASTSFSLQLGGKPVGLFMAIYGAAGSVGRILFPLVAGASTSNSQINGVPFILSACLCIVLTMVHARQFVLGSSCCQRRRMPDSEVDQEMVQIN